MVLTRRIRSLALRRARPFFSFANPLTNPQALVKSHQETKIVPFAPEEMYDVVADVDRYHEFLPFCVESRVLRRPNDNVMEAALRIGFKVFTESYTSRVIMKRPEKIVIKSIESPTFKRIESEWSFQRLENPNSCKVQFRVTFEVASFLHANAIQLFFDDVAVTQLNAFISRTARLQSLRARQPRSSASAINGRRNSNSSAPVATTTSDTSTISNDAQPPPAARSVVTSPSAVSTSADTTQLASAASKAAAIIDDDVWAQDCEHVKYVFSKYAVGKEKLYFGGFIKACRELGCEYEDCKHVSEDSALAGAIFSSFEISETPKDWLNWEEFQIGVYLLTKGTVEEKANILFHVIDTSGDGKISREELTRAMQRRIRTVKKIFPKLLTDQVALQMESENVKALSVDPNEAISRGLQAIESMMEEIEKDIPLAVNQIFLETDLDQDDFITQDEWLFAWQSHPEFVELMTIDGMKKVAQWASVVKSEPGDDGDEDDTRLTYVD